MLRVFIGFLNTQMNKNEFRVYLSDFLGLG